MKAINSTDLTIVSAGTNMSCEDALFQLINNDFDDLSFVKACTKEQTMKFATAYIDALYVMKDIDNA
jgi:uncharacterized protein YjgD (DUF1641 family)